MFRDEEIFWVGPRYCEIDFPSVKPRHWMDFFIHRKKSEFVGRCEDETLGRTMVFLAALSTFSLQGMPKCLTAHMNVIGVQLEAKVVKRV